jgi:hypothetical protein
LISNSTGIPNKTLFIPTLRESMGSEYPLVKLLVRDP